MSFLVMFTGSIQDFEVLTSRRQIKDRSRPTGRLFPRLPSIALDPLPITSPQHFRAAQSVFNPLTEKISEKCNAEKFVA